MPTSVVCVVLQCEIAVVCAVERVFTHVLTQHFLKKLMLMQVWLQRTSRYAVLSRGTLQPVWRFPLTTGAPQSRRSNAVASQRPRDYETCQSPQQNSWFFAVVEDILHTSAACAR